MSGLMKVMKVICAWCGLLIRDGREPVSHGICDRCKARELGRLKVTETDRAYWEPVESD